MRFLYHKISVRIGLTFISLSGVFLSLLCFINNGYLVFGIVNLALSCFIIIYPYREWIYIGDKGVMYTSINKKYKIDWIDIKHIDVRGMNLGRGRIDVLCFSKEYIIDITPKNMNNDFILMLNINRKAIKVIKRYWNGNIGGLNAIKLYQ